MAHELIDGETGNVSLVLHAKPGWHGLGTVVADAQTPVEALVTAGMDELVVKRPLFAVADDGSSIDVADKRGVFYKGSRHCLGIVGKDYQPIQNRELAEFCMSLAENNDTVRVETAGMIRNGAKVWFLLKGHSFSVRGHGDDEIAPYICISNGHDGWTAMRGTNTTVRVVCSNTLHMVIPDGERESGTLKMKQSQFVCKHTTGIMGKVEEAKQMLKLYNKSLDATREIIDALAARDADNKMVQQFFLECYIHDFGAVPLNAKTDDDEKKLMKSREAFGQVLRRFEAERKLAGANLWNAMNAYTGWLQNDKQPKSTRDPKGAMERRQNSKLFGTDADRAHYALTKAVQIAG